MTGDIMRRQQKRSRGMLNKVILLRKTQFLCHTNGSTLLWRLSFFFSLPYLPDLTPLDYHLLPALKLVFKRTVRTCSMRCGPDLRSFNKKTFVITDKVINIEQKVNVLLEIRSK